MHNTDRIRLWIEALESGEYQQGREVLHRLDLNDHYYCCLGVACEVAMKNGLVLIKNLDFSAYEYGDEHNETALPLEVATWYGFEYEEDDGGADPVISRDDGSGDELTAIEANDRLHMTFPEIAQKLRDHYNIH